MSDPKNTIQKTVKGSYWADNKAQSRIYGYLWIGSEARNWNLKSVSKYDAHRLQWEPKYSFLEGPLDLPEGKVQKI